jgi:hypothetical protein
MQQPTDGTNKSKGQRLRDLFDNINKNTAKEDLYWNIKFAMLLTIAKREGYVTIISSNSLDAYSFHSF